MKITAQFLESNNACNGFHSERAAKINETKTARLLKLAETIAGIMGFTIEHQPDPRGCSLHLINPKDTNERVAI